MQHDGNKMTDQPAPPQTPLLDTVHPDRVYDIPQTIRAMRAAGVSPAGAFFEWLKLRCQRNRLRPGDYLAMRLWDRTLYQRARLEDFADTLNAIKKLYPAANFRTDMNALALSKIASDAILAAHGLPVVPLLNLHTTRVFPSPGRTASTQALESFLLNGLSCPAFGKPLWGTQSLGSISLASRDAAAGTVALQDGRIVKAADLAREIHARYGFEGYIFQPKLAPHEAVRAICGDRVATVRVVTIMKENVPYVLRTCWKIPAGANMADNFWRRGNILAGIDMGSGTVTRALTRSGADLRIVEAHPDTGTRLAGLKVPLWEEICKTALFGMAAMGAFGIIGWDIAATADGPVIIDVNETPDPALPQMADGKGLADATFMEFLAGRRAERKLWQEAVRRYMKKEHSAIFSFTAAKDAQ